MLNKLSDRQKWFRFSRWDGLAACGAVLYWGLYCRFGVDLYFFQEPRWEYRRIFLLLLILLVVAMRRLICRAVLQKDAFSRKFLRYTAVNLLVLLALMLLLWPGTWSWDDIHVLNQARSYSLYAWQHYLSSEAMILSAYFLPSAGGIVVVQLVIAAFVSGYCLTLVDTGLLDRGRRYHGVAVLLADLAFFLPPILFYDYSKFRNTLCSYLELLLLALTWRMARTPGARTVGNLCLFLTAAILTAAWRSENLYYIVLVLGLLLFIAGRRRWKRCLAATLAVCAAVVAIGRYNTGLIGNDNYAVMAIINPVVEVIREAERHPDGLREEQHDAIGKVLDWDRLMAEPLASGSALYWDGAVLSYTQEEYRAFQKTCLQLVLRYPAAFLQERAGMFWNTLGFNDFQYDPYTRTIRIFMPDTAEAKSWKENGEALNVSLREATIRLLAGRDEDGNKNLSNHIFWNLLPPLVFALAALVYGVRKRRWLFAYLVFCNLCKVPLIFATAPDTYFMYYMSVYLFGYVVAFGALAAWFNRRCPAKTACQGKELLTC
ncbi:DUF6020 family protein [Subdoligranulum variabile]|uniref:Glycosyltransferase RgtA/B/C/D-like domain-containing protein n=1 Tax=Subdoligranulum variabile DSM 15176 TaxID=411471 RepID=D1PRE0_9FIRM|nr:DUF6020 family protein [Subdoligranulum variabile]EFB74744.1 hypothetical protein SUBVAR_06969 [Subdoligranulum variabile DSM 15176]UWP69428.1 DUF6020 family protein [Subdoligranulum variabile]